MTSPFDRGIFTFSLDFELIWGSRDLFAADLTPLHTAALTTRAQVFGPLLDMLVSLGITATWATVGHLFLAEGRPEGGRLHPKLHQPSHAWLSAPWLEGVPAGTEAEHPAYYGQSLVLRLRDAGQEIGSHSFTHAIFGDPGCSRAVADSELAHCVQAAAALDIPLRSLVFPRNRAGHTDLLVKHGFTCWRSLEPVWYQHARVPASVGRLAHLAEVATAQSPPTVLPFQDAHGLWCIPASGSFLPTNGVRGLIPLRQRVRRAQRGITRAAESRRLSHFWIHPINLADDPPRLLRAIREILEHAARLRDAGRLDILPMAEVAAQAALRSRGEAGRSARSSRG